MPDERSSPSGGWRSVYDAMETDTSVEPSERSCPDCGRPSEHLFRDVYHCDEHGYWNDRDEP